MGRDVIRQLASSAEVVSRRIERLIQERGDIESIALGGSPVVDFPDHLLQAAQSVASYRGYAHSMGEPPLREAIATRVAAEGIRTGVDEVLVTNGAMQALDVCFRTILRQGDAVLMPRPGFFIDGLVERAGGTVVSFPSPERDGFRPDWESARRVITPSVRVLFLNSPVNPTGYVFDDSDLEEAARLAVEHDLWIVSDESYSHFVYGGRVHRSIASVDEVRDRTILVRSFSKDFAMPGWRLGYIAMPAALALSLARCFERTCLCVNRVAQQVGLAALSGPQDWIRKFVADSERRATLVHEELSAIGGIVSQQPAGGLNLLVRFTGDTDELVRRLIFQGGVPVHPGEAFGAPGYFRLQFGAPDDAARAALAQLSKIVGSLSA